MTPKEVTCEPIVTVQLPTAVVEVVEELTESEADDRHRLELRVEKAFYHAGIALRELRDRRLYRSTHRTFEEYCLERFNYARRAAYCLISAADVVDNLSKCDQIDHILPTKESQCRPLTQLKSEEQRQVWQQAVEQSGGKVPSSRTVKEIVERLKERNATPNPILYKEGDVVEIRAGSTSTLRKNNGCWGIIIHIGTFSCKVHISVRNVSVQCKPDEMDPVDPKYTADIRAVSARIAALSELDLDPAILSVLETLSRQTCFTQIQLNLLAWAEQQYGISPKTEEKFSHL